MNPIHKNKGFSLIELLIVIAIIGTLAAIAIPLFSSYRISSYNSSAQVDLRNLINGEETFYAENQSYTNVPAIEGYQESLTNLPGVRVGKLICASVTNATMISFTASTQHKNGDLTFSISQTGNKTETSKNAGTYNLGCPAG